MGREEDLALWKSGYEAFANGDLDALNEILADDVVWHVAGTSAIAGDYTGKEEVFGFFGKLLELSGGTFKIDIHDVLASEDHAVALVTATGERDGESLEANAVHVGHIENGQLREFWSIPENDQEQRAFWDD